MSENYKNFFSTIGLIFLVVLMAGFQVSFLNSSFLELNLFLILVLYFVLIRDNSKALILAWLGGVLISPSHFSDFGITSLIFLVLAAILIIIYKILFLTLKTESILLMGAVSIALYYFLTWLITRGESAFDFLNSKILVELILTTLLLLIIFKVRSQNV